MENSNLLKKLGMTKEDLVEIVRLSNEDQRKIMENIEWWRRFFPRRLNNLMEERFCSRCGNPAVGDFPKIMSEVITEAQRREREKIAKEVEGMKEDCEVPEMEEHKVKLAFYNAALDKVLEILRV